MQLACSVRAILVGNVHVKLLIGNRALLGVWERGLALWHGGKHFLGYLVLLE